MAVMHGKLGKIEWDTAVSDVPLTLGQSWDGTVTHDVAEITSMQDTAKTYITGHQDWSASVTCLLPLAGGDISIDSGNNPNGMGDVAARLELYFKHDTGTPIYRAVYGNAICNGISINNENEGVPTVTYSFKGAGQLVWYSSGAAEPA